MKEANSTSDKANTTVRSALFGTLTQALASFPDKLSLMWFKTSQQNSFGSIQATDLIVWVQKFNTVFL